MQFNQEMTLILCCDTVDKAYQSSYIIIKKIKLKVQIMASKKNIWPDIFVFHQPLSDVAKSEFRPWVFNAWKRFNAWNLLTLERITLNRSCELEKVKFLIWQ